ncbi:hypothetical protein BBAD15_g4559 [Beauveria bassiana D1-5]|uniref:Peptidase S1 domain-containing protein n=1 Tax=Beauveria bassiana D1-5 TaxID=1245745 RepID=A0A0A2VQF5_BEABA|nr:hypothetical protein BBAD15_g4559 [Beauveria bassiana D1-5]
MKAAFAFTLTAGLPVALASAILGPRIIGPDEPTDRFKFVVSIQDSTKAHYCGGMLLDSTTVLTATFSGEVIGTNNKMGDIAIIKLATPIEKSDDIDYAPLLASDAVPDESEELVGVGCLLEEEWAECRPFVDLMDACVPCAEKATADSTVETVIQGSEAMKKGD